MTPATVTERGTEQTTDKTAIRPFRFEAPEAELDEMRRRITATRFPEKETVADPSQGVQLAFIQALARYWATEYAWRRGDTEQRDESHDRRRREHAARQTHTQDATDQRESKIQHDQETVT